MRSFASDDCFCGVGSAKRLLNGSVTIGIDEAAVKKYA